MYGWMIYTHPWSFFLQPELYCSYHPCFYHYHPCLSSAHNRQRSQKRERESSVGVAPCVCVCVCVRERGEEEDTRDEERSRDETVLRPPLRLQLDRSAKREEICAAWISKTERKKWGNEAFWFSVMKYLYHKRSSLSLSDDSFLPLVTGKIVYLYIAPRID